MGWGGQIKYRPERDDYHCTLWRSDDDKGDRLSWNMKSGSDRADDAHHTRQSDNKHSSTPDDWRAPVTTDDDVVIASGNSGCIVPLTLAFGATLASSLAISAIVHIL